MDCALAGRLDSIAGVCCPCRPTPHSNAPFSVLHEEGARFTLGHIQVDRQHLAD